MIYRFLFLTLLTGLSFNACQSGGGSAGAGDFTGYTLESLPGTSYQRAYRLDGKGEVLEEGLVLNGKKSGSWVMYHPDSYFPKMVYTYADGILNGPTLEYTDRGQLISRTGYKNNELDGTRMVYQYGRLKEETRFKAGKLDGITRKYSESTGKLQQEIPYKNGRQDGVYRYYNDEGQVTMEYEYKNGEKVSGGMTNGGR